MSHTHTMNADSYTNFGECLEKLNTGEISTVDYIPLAPIQWETLAGIPMPIVFNSHQNVASYAGCNPAAYTYTKNKNKEDNTMGTTEYDIYKDKVQYMLDHVYSILDDKLDIARRKFGLKDDPAPTTVKEMQERIKAGKFIVTSVYTDERYPELRWRDPALKEDNAGYQDASAKIETMKEKVKLKINTLSIEEGYKALEQFEQYEV